MLFHTLSRSFALTAAFVVLCVWTGSGYAAEEASYDVVDSAGIYYGDGNHPTTPAVIVADDVWAKIPEYRRIIDEELTDDDAAYHLLLKKATRRFKKALRKAANRDGYDMIGEVGSIEASSSTKKAIPDITSDLIDLVTRD